MTRYIRLAVGVLVGGASLLAAAPAGAQTMCNDATALPNPIVVSGSTAFEPTLRKLAAKLALESSPYSIILATGSTAAGSCNGVSTIATGTDLGGTTGRYYTGADGAGSAMCTFAAGQKADVGISDVYYESCMNVTQPKAADIMDVTGPAQAMVFIVPSANTTTGYLTYKDAQTLYGCGVTTTRAIAGFSMSGGVYCRDSSSGTQITVAKNVGLPEGVLATPICVNGGGTSGVVTGVTGFPDAQNAIGFIAADALDTGTNRMMLNPLAFQALGQTKAYYADSARDVSDRKNVRDGHYTIWGYEHFLAKTTAGALSTRVADFIGYVNGTKTSPNFDYVTLEGGAGVIPACAMHVKRSTDGGLLSPNTPADTCDCAFVAAITKTATPAGCTACTGTGASTCASPLTCHHGFCE